MDEAEKEELGSALLNDIEAFCKTVPGKTSRFDDTVVQECRLHEMMPQSGGDVPDSLQDLRIKFAIQFATTSDLLIINGFIPMTCSKGQEAQMYLFIHSLYAKGFMWYGRFEVGESGRMFYRLMQFFPLTADTDVRKEFIDGIYAATRKDMVLFFVELLKRQLGTMMMPEDGVTKH